MNFQNILIYLALSTLTAGCKSEIKVASLVRGSSSTDVPTIVIGEPSALIAIATDLITFDVVYTNAVSMDLTAADVVISGGPKATATIVSSTTEKATVQLTNFTGDGPLQISIAEKTSVGHRKKEDKGAGPSTVVTVDNTKPLVPNLTPASTTYTGSQVMTFAQNATADVNFKEFRYTTTGTAPTSCSDGTASTGTYTATGTVTQTIKVVACDKAGLMSETAASSTLTYATAGPTVTAVTSTKTNGSYKVGEVIGITVTFSESVTVTGTPQLTLETGTTDAVVNYTSGSPGLTLTFNYTVASGDTSADLDYASTTALALNGGTIKDTALNNATLTLVAPSTTTGATIANGKAIVIDTTLPVIAYTSISPTSPGTSATPSITMSLSEASSASSLELFSNVGCTTSISTAVPGTSGSNAVTTSTLTANATTTIYAKMTDVAGNASTCTSMVSYLYDTPPTAGTFSASTGKTVTGFTLNWSVASDVVTTAASLQYLVCSGASTAALDTVAECDGATQEMAYTANVLTLAITGKTASTTYYYNVIVKDAAGNKSLYDGLTQATSTTPTISITDPDGTGDSVSESTYPVAITAAAPDTVGTINLYYHTVNTSCTAGLSGWTSIVSSLAENTTSYAWNTTALASGKYYVCGVITDGSSTVYSVSSGMLTVKAFISTWDTTKTGSANTTIVLPLSSTGTYNFTVDWGDGSSNTITAWNDANKTHVYAAGGTKTLTITGTLTGWVFNNTGDKRKITNISQWGSFRFGTMEGGYFYGANNLTITATDIPDLTGTTSMNQAFRNCGSLTTVPSMNSWNTAAVTNMSFMFSYASTFNQNIGSWNTAAVTDMSSMFLGASTFNQNIGGWNTAAVTAMSSMFNSASTFNQNISGWVTTAVTTMANMFLSATVFNQDIGSWNTAAVTNMSSMLYGATVFNQDISSWNTAAVTNMSFMFYGASTFNLNIGSWNTAAVTNMSSMFSGASAFNQNIGSWNTAAVTNMFEVFYYATAFNQNISSWSTAAVTTMYGMFYGATAFNQDISGWNTAAVTSMRNMFYGATAFNQDISGWNTVAVTEMTSMFTLATAFSTLNYDSFLIALTKFPVKAAAIWLGAAAKYSNGTAATARAALVAQSPAWTITDGGVNTTWPTSGAFAATTNLAATTLTLNWTKGSDTGTAQNLLEYYVCTAATANSIDTVGECLAAAGGSGWTADIATMNVTTLTASTTYFFNVVMRDPTGSVDMVIYNGVTATTTP